MPRKIGALRTGETTELRALTGVIAADSATLTDANIPPALAIDFAGYDTVMVGVEITGGTAPTMTLEALFRDEDAPDGSRWSRLLLGAPDGVTPAAPASETTPALPSNAQFAELRVLGHRAVFLRVAAVTNPAGTASAKILARPGRVRGDRPLTRHQG